MYISDEDAPIMGYHLDVEILYAVHAAPIVRVINDTRRQQLERKTVPVRKRQDKRSSRNARGQPKRGRRRSGLRQVETVKQEKDE